MGKQNVMSGEDEDQQEELVVVEKKPVDLAEEKDEDEDDDGPEERTVKRTEGDVGDDTDPERKALRERRKQEKLERKHRKEEAIRRNNIEMEFLRKRNEDLERRIGGIEAHTVSRQASDIESQMNDARRQFQQAETVIAKATAAGKGEDVVTAMRYRDEARQRFNDLAQAKEQFEQARQPRQPAEPQVDPVVLRHAKAFMDQNDWYDPSGRDEDSAIVLAIDNTLVKEGYDPKSKEYWAELKRRTARRLPDRFNAKAAADDGDDDDGDDEPAPRPARVPRGGPAVGSGRDNGPQGSRREIYISPERKQALIDTGAWDDPILRAKYVKRYAEWDKQQKTKSR